MTIQQLRFLKWFSTLVMIIALPCFAQSNTDQLQLTAVKSTDAQILGELQNKASATTGAVKKPLRGSAEPNQYDPHQLFGPENGDDERGFQKVARDAMPLTPEQIVRLKQMLSVTQRASAATGDTPPKPTLSTQIVNLSPGAVPPVIRLQQGFVTSAVFVDSTGADWPIDSYDLGNSRAFNIQWQQGSNVLMIQAISMYTYGNLAVKLQGLSTPVMLTLVPGQKLVDYRVDLRVQKSGPHANPMSENSLPTAANESLLGILDGIAPQGAQVLHVNHKNCQAWLAKEKMYLRTNLTVLSPAWVAVMTSPDGTNAYEMQQSSTVLVSQYGKPVELKIEGL